MPRNEKAMIVFLLLVGAGALTVAVVVGKFATEQVNKREHHHGSKN